MASAFAHGIDGAADAAIGGNYDDFDFRIDLPGRAQHRQAVHVRHAKVGQDQVHQMLL